MVLRGFATGITGSMASACWNDPSMTFWQPVNPTSPSVWPGPMNRGVEIASEVADGPQSVILKQVTFGIAVRMAVMSIVAGN